MGRWLARIKKESRPVLTKPSSVSSVSNDCDHFQKIASPKLISTGSPSNAQVNTTTLLTVFFNKAEQLGIELLADDKQWLKGICYGVPMDLLKQYLKQYIEHWQNAMKNETSSIKKQNVGRSTANTFIRETLEKLTDKTAKTLIKTGDNRSK